MKFFPFKEVETDEKNKSRLSLGGLSSPRRSPTTGQTASKRVSGSVPLLASDEDLSSTSQLKSSGGSVPLKNRDSYSTVVWNKYD